MAADNDILIANDRYSGHSLDRRVRALALQWYKRAKLYHNAGERSSDPLKAIAQTLRNCADELRATAKKRPNPRI